MTAQEWTILCRGKRGGITYDEERLISDLEAALSHIKGGGE